MYSYFFFLIINNSRFRDISYVAGNFTHVHETNPKNSHTQNNNLWATQSVFPGGDRTHNPQQSSKRQYNCLNHYVMCVALGRNNIHTSKYITLDINLHIKSLGAWRYLKTDYSKINTFCLSKSRWLRHGLKENRHYSIYI